MLLFEGSDKLSCYYQTVGIDGLLVDPNGSCVCFRGARAGGGARSGLVGGASVWQKHATARIHELC